MSDDDHVLGLLDDLLKLAAGSSATSIEVEADGFSASLVRDAAIPPAAAASESDGAAEAAPDRTQRVHATTVGIFSAAREWSAGDVVTRGTVLGGIQSLGQVAELTCPADGTIKEVLVAGGAPVEYGQPLFAIERS